MNSLCELYLRIAPDKFHFLKFVLEAYDNLAILSCFERSQGVVVVRFSETMAKDLFGLLDSLAADLR